MAKRLPCWFSRCSIILLIVYSSISVYAWPQMPSQTTTVTATENDTRSAQSQTQLYRGNYAEAIAILTELVAQEPQAKYYYNLGLAYSNIGSNKEAITNFQKALELRNDYLKAYAGLGSLYAKIGQKELAIETFNKALKLLSKAHAADDFIGMGNLDDAVGRPKQAIESYQIAIKLEANNPDAHYFLGASLFDAGDTKSALTQFQQTVAICPDFVAAHAFMGIIYSQQGNYQEAVTPLKKALEINPKDRASHLFLGTAYIYLNDRPAAVKEYEALKSLDEQIAHNLLAEIEAMDGANANIANNRSDDSANPANSPNNSRTDAPPNTSPQEPITRPVGNIRIGLLPLRNKTAAALALEQLSQRLIGIFAQNRFQADVLGGGSLDALVAEANNKDCDYVVTMEVVQLTNVAVKPEAEVKTEDKATDSYEVAVVFTIFSRESSQPKLKLKVISTELGSADSCVFATLTQGVKEIAMKLDIKRDEPKQ